MSKIDLEHYMTARYVDGGREWPNYDCWGLVRHAYHVINGEWLPLYSGLDADNTYAKSRNYLQLSKVMVECEPHHGAIAAVVNGRVCEHVAICVQIGDELLALEMDHTTGPRVVTLDKFKDDHRHVKYYASA